jgi:3-dehydro-L-gulonate 2-dehydrogenase
LPIGFWKGSGLSLVLDLLATVLSQGQSTAVVTNNGSESGVSQVFICIQPKTGLQTEALIEEIITYTKSSRPERDGGEIFYPGENTLRTREKSLKDGVWVDEVIWEKVRSL